jgi:predicted ATPase
MATPNRRYGRYASGQAGFIRPGPTLLGFQVANFKSIASAEVQPTSLTLLAGANSSGKSSLLQALLFFTQSSLADDVVLNGDLVKLGEPKDALRDGSDAMSFAFSVVVSTRSDGQLELVLTTYSLLVIFEVLFDELSLTGVVVA